MQAEIQLLRAAKKGDYDRVRAAMRSCKTLNCRDQNGYTALHWAAAEGHLKVLTALLQSQRVNVHAKTKSGASALHWAAGQGSAEAVKQLLVYKADPRQEDEQGETALFWGCTNAHPQVVNLLLVAKAKPSHADRDGCSAIEVAEASKHQSKRHAQVLQMMVDAQKRQDRAKEAYRVLKQQKAEEAARKREAAERRAQEEAVRKARQAATRRSNMGPPAVPAASRRSSNSSVSTMDRDRASTQKSPSQALAATSRIIDSPSRGRLVWDARERELLAEINELRAQLNVEERNAEEHQKALAAQRERETKLLAEVAEMEIHANSAKSKLARYKKSQDQEIEGVAAEFQRKIAALQERVATAKDAGFHAERLEKSLKEATDMIRSQQAQLEAQNKVAAMHAQISAAAQANATNDAEVIDNLTNEVTELRRNLDEMQSTHRRDVNELNDECDARIALAEKQALALVEEQSKHDQEARARELAAARQQAETELKSLRKQEAAALEKVEGATRKKLAKVEAKLREVEDAARQWESNCQQCEALVLQERQRLEEAQKEKEEVISKLEASEAQARETDEEQQARLAEMEQHLEAVEQHAEEQLAAMHKKYAAKQERYQAKVAEMKRNSKKMLKSVEGHQHGSAQALQQLSEELEASRAQEATLFDELQTIHAEYATRDKHAQQTLELQNQTVAMEHQQQLQALRLQLTRAAEDKVKAAKEEFAKENAALQQELNDHREQLNQLSVEYAQAEEQMQQYAASLEQHQKETIREAEQRAQARQGAQWDEQLRELRRKLEDEAEAAARQAEAKAREQLVAREEQILAQCQEKMDREAAVFDARMAGLEQQHQQEVAALVVQNQARATQLIAANRAEMEEQRANFRRRREAEAAEWRSVRQQLDARVDELQEQLSALASRGGNAAGTGSGALHRDVMDLVDSDHESLGAAGDNTLAAAGAAAGSTGTRGNDGPTSLRKSVAAQKGAVEELGAQLFKDQARAADHEGQLLMDELMRAATETFEEVPIF